MTIRAVIVDDEPPARRKVRRFLDGAVGVEVIGEAGSGTEAVGLIQKTRPDLVFLDIQLPDMDGFAVLDALNSGGVPLPQVVFVTAYDEYAVKAFSVHALDYLLKPFDAARFSQSLERARSGRGHGTPPTDAALASLLEEVRTSRSGLERVLVQQGVKSILLKLDEVDWIEAAENYCALHSRGKRYLVRVTLTELERRLDRGKFIRIHRSRIVNMERIAELHPWSHGDWLVVLADGTELRMSRRYRGALPTLGAE